MCMAADTLALYTLKGASRHRLLGLLSVAVRLALDPALLADIRGAPLTVLLALAMRANAQGECFPGLSVLCRDTGYSKNTVSKALEALGSKALVARFPRPNTSTLYRIHKVDPPAPASGSENDRPGRDAARDSQELTPNSVVVKDSLLENEPETTTRSGSENEPRQLNLDEWAAAERRIVEAGVYPAVASRIVSQRRAEGRQPDFLLAWWGEYDDRLHSERAKGPGWLAHVLEHADDYPPRHAPQADCEARPEVTPPATPRTLSAREQAEARYGVRLDPDLYEMWKRALREMRLGMTQAAYTQWFSDSLLLALEGDLATIGAGTPSAREWLEHRFYGHIKRALDRVVGRPVEMAFTVLERKPVGAR